MSKTLDDVVEELAAIRKDMVTRADFAAESAAVRSEQAALRTELNEVRSELHSGLEAVRSEQEDFKDEVLRAISGISIQQTTFVTLLTKLLSDREEADRRFAKLEAAVFGSKH